jgi:hypothetical protein
MSPCGSSPSRALLPPAESAPLIQIREEYRTHWHDLTFSVEKGSSQCTVRVQDSGQNGTLYMAYRSGLRAARLAAAEFAISRSLGIESRISPESLDKQLSWEPYREAPRNSCPSPALFLQ